VPIGALTAWQGLFNRAKLEAGQRVLVHGGAGAVGVFAIQLAHSHGAHVIVTASPRNRDFVLSLGAQEFIDYRGLPFEERARNIDVVFDTVGGETLERSWSVLKPGRTHDHNCRGRGSRYQRSGQTGLFIVEPNGRQLSKIGVLLEAGPAEAGGRRGGPVFPGPSRLFGSHSPKAWPREDCDCTYRHTASASG